MYTLDICMYLFYRMGKLECSGHSHSSVQLILQPACLTNSFRKGSLIKKKSTLPIEVSHQKYAPKRKTKPILRSVFCSHTRILLLTIQTQKILHQQDILSHKALNSQVDTPLDQILFTIMMLLNSVLVSRNQILVTEKEIIVFKLNY